jgi:hypothetical protein
LTQENKQILANSTRLEKITGQRVSSSFNTFTILVSNSLILIFLRTDDLRHKKSVSATSLPVIQQQLNEVKSAHSALRHEVCEQIKNANTLFASLGRALKSTANAKKA